MAANERLIKDWIQYLKNNQIVDMQSDPKTGQLKYRRQPNTEDLFQFLDTNSNFGEEKIMSVIDFVMSKNTGSTPKLPQRDNPTSKNSDSNNLGPDTPSKNGKYLKSRPEDGNVIDGEYTDGRSDRMPAQDPRDKKLRVKLKTPGSGKKKPHFTYKGVNEDFTDKPGKDVNEKEVEQIFNILLSQQTYSNDEEQDTKAAPAQQSPQQTSSTQEENIRKIKRVIRDAMTPAQRKALWRALSEDLTEEQITNADVKEILKSASDIRNNPGVLGRIPGFRKDKINVADLQQAWKDAGFPDDTRDIYAILKDEFGFADKEIKKIFTQVFGDNGDYETPEVSHAIQGIANYAKKNGIDSAIREFMKREFGEELGVTKKQGIFKEVFSQKAKVEEIRQIFETIVGEERIDRDVLIRQTDKIHLGRSKK